MTRPPITAVKRVDFLRQTAMVKGEINKDTDTDRAPNQPGKKERKTNYFIRRCHEKQFNSKFKIIFLGISTGIVHDLQTRRQQCYVPRVVTAG